MTPLITKQQIGNFVTLSENIDSLNIDTFIRDAQEFDTISIFPQSLLTAIEINVIAKIQQWSRTKTYTAGDIILYETYYTALSNNTGSQPPSGSWEANELMDFYLQYLQPFIAYSFYYRFIAYYGAFVTQKGIRSMNDETSTEISDKRRAEMLGDIKSKVNVWTGKIGKKLNDVSYTFDGVVYTQDSGKQIKQGVKIYALGGDKRRSNCPPFLNHDIV